METGRDNRYNGMVYDSFVLLLSVLALANLAISLLLFFQPDIIEVVGIVNLFLGVVFFGDFLYRLHRADLKYHYFIHNGGWADLLSAVPLAGMKIFRIYRIVEVVRRLRTYRAKQMVDELSVNRAHGALFIILLWIVLIIEVAAILILHVERHAAGASIHTAGDAIWWAFVTITTVGYGDLTPVTPTGRIIAIVLMVSGVGVFATFAGFLSTKLISPAKKGKTSPGDFSGTDKKIDEILSRLDAQQEMTSAILRQLEGNKAAAGGTTEEDKETG